MAVGPQYISVKETECIKGQTKTVIPLIPWKFSHQKSVASSIS